MSKKHRQLKKITHKGIRMIAFSSLCFTHLSFEETCAQIARLGFGAADVAVMQGWAHFNPSELYVFRTSSGCPLR